MARGPSGVLGRCESLRRPMTCNNGRVSTEPQEHDLASVRRSLIDDFCLLPGDGDVVRWQRRLASEIVKAESAVSKKAGASKVSLQEFKQHRRQLRLIGDALVCSLLSTHAIRALCRPGPPPALSAQWADFEFVLDTADRLLESGLVPIVSDVTSLIGIGDIVAWHGNSLGVFECKNRDAPPRSSASGRLARQRQSGERLEHYLKYSYVDEPDGRGRVALSADLPDPEWDKIRQLLEECEVASSKSAVLTFGEGDYMIACDRRSCDPRDLDPVFEQLSPGKLPAFASYSDLARWPDFRARSPVSYPLSAKSRWELLEGHVLLFRLVDMSQLDAQFDHKGSRLSLTTARSSGGFEVQIHPGLPDGLTFLPSLTEYCLWAPVPVDSMREFLVTYARKMLDIELEVAEAELADGDDVKYATIYRDQVVMKQDA